MQLTGTLQLTVNYIVPNSAGGYQVPFGTPLAVTGTVNPSGGFTLTGSKTWISGDVCHVNGTSRLTQFTANVDASQRLAGAFVYGATQNITSCYYTDATVYGQLLAVTKAP